MRNIAIALLLLGPNHLYTENNEINHVRDNAVGYSYGVVLNAHTNEDSGLAIRINRH
jgi:hypothetical protein